MPSNRDLFSHPKSTFTYPVADNVWHVDQHIIITDENVLETDSQQTSVTFTPGNANAVWKRVGDTFWVRGGFVVVSHAASTAALFLPFGLRIDITKLQGLTGGNFAKVGTAENLINNTDPINSISLIVDPAFPDRIFFSAASAGFQYAKATGSGVAGGTNGTYVTFEYQIPIAGWTAQ